jgi:hypothetical protein
MAQMPEIIVLRKVKETKTTLEYEEFKPKTNLDKLRIVDIDRFISWFCRGRPCATCPYNGVECGIRDWLEEEVKE